MVEGPRIQFAKKNCVTPIFEAVDLVEKALSEIGNAVSVDIARALCTSLLTKPKGRLS